MAFPTHIFGFDTFILFILVRDHILFVDTETSGLPKDWNSSDLDQWPYIIQIAWVIYTREGQLLKSENYYISDDKIIIDPKSKLIHGISEEILQEKGEKRNKVLRKIYKDIKFYNPLMVGHWVSFDMQMLSVGFRRAGIPNITQDVPLYCTMLSNSHYVRFASNNYPKLDELYEKLFNKSMEGQHDALFDAQATAACFFELVKRKEITDERISNQQPEFRAKINKKDKFGCGLPVLILMITILYFLI